MTRLDHRRKKERKARHEARQKARQRAAQMAQAEGIGEEGNDADSLFSLAAIKVRPASVLGLAWLASGIPWAPPGGWPARPAGINELAAAATQPYSCARASRRWAICPARTGRPTRRGAASLSPGA